ncbi:MAG TPA: hypothetical protein VFM83_06485 [Gaiellaceae bacterium]|nr:hypothetical protein [Gaiellaceae bacterium]
MRRFFIVGTLLLTLVLSACGGTAEEDAAESPAAVEQIKGTELNRVTLTAEAAKRLDVQTVAARSDGKRTVIPYAAVLYDPDGRTWTYTSPEQLVFVRKDINVDRIDGDSAILIAGPSPGTAVVTVGADELWGVEYGGIEED